MTAREELGYRQPETCRIHGFVLPCAACAYFLTWPTSRSMQQVADNPERETPNA